MRSVDLAVYADLLAAEAATLAARAERARAQLRQAAIEQGARAALPAATAERLEALGLLRATDARSLRTELDGLEHDLAALAELQAWVEGQLVAIEV